MQGFDDTFTPLNSAGWYPGLSSIAPYAQRPAEFKTDNNIANGLYPIASTYGTTESIVPAVAVAPESPNFSGVSTVMAEFDIRITGPDGSHQEGVVYFEVI